MNTAEWIESYRVAWEKRSPDAAASLFAEECTYRSNIYEEPHRGRSGVRQYWEDVTDGQSNVTVRMGSPATDDKFTAVEFWTTMTVAGADLTLAGCLMLKFDDNGLCSTLWEYWQANEGVLEPPPEWGG